MNIDFKNDEILFLEGETGMVGVVKVAYEDKMLFIATQDNEEIVQFLESDDIIAVSNFKKDKRAIRSQAYLSREESSPLEVSSVVEESRKLSSMEEESSVEEFSKEDVEESLVLEGCSTQEISIPQIANNGSNFLIFITPL